MNFPRIFVVIYILLFPPMYMRIVTGLELSDILDEVPGLRHMGTKTPYIFSTSHKKSKQMEALALEMQEIRKFFKNEEWKHICKPVHVSFTGRHGNRLPSLENMKYMEKFVEEIQDKLDNRSIRPETHGINAKLYQTIQNWVLPYKYSEEKLLNDWGHNEIYGIAERFARNFRDLFMKENFLHEDEDVTNYVKPSRSEILEDILVLSSDKSRSLNSATEFLRGLRDVIQNPFITDAKIEHANHLMRFHDECSKFKRIWKSGVLDKEIRKYIESTDILGIAEKIAKKLSLYRDITAPGKLLGKENAGKILWSILNACYGETAYTGTLSAWCSLLDEEDFKKLAFGNDLKHYYKNTGYVETTGGRQSCELMQHIFHYMDNTIGGRRLRRPHQKMIFRFGHAETLIPLYSLLGLYKESEPLTADYKKHKGRVFQMSEIVPHSANLQVVLYECAETEEPTPIKLDQYMVQFLVNEVEQTLPMCKYNLCSYGIVRDYYIEHIEFCNINEICEKGYKNTRNEL